MHKIENWASDILYINKLSTSIYGQFLTFYQSSWKKRTETKNSAIIIRDGEREKTHTYTITNLRHND